MPDLLHSLDPDQLVVHHAWMRRLARSLVIDDSEADDVVQEAWLKAAEKPPDKPAALGAWLATVVRNAAKQLARGESRRDRREVAVAKAEALPSTSELVARAESRRILLDATLALSEPGRSTVLLRFFEGLPPREIAKRQGVPVETVRSRVRRALGEMRVSLDATHGGDRRAWALVLLPLAGPPIPGAVAPGSVPADAPPSVPLHAPQIVTPFAAAAALVVAGGAAGWFAAAPGAAETELSALRARVGVETQALADVTARTTRARTDAEASANSARRVRAQTADTRMRTQARTPAPSTSQLTAEPAASTAAARAPFAFPAHSDLLRSQDWEAEGRAFAALIRALRTIVEPLAAGEAPSPESIAELQVRNGPVIALALRLKAGGVEGSIPNVVLAHPAVLSNLLPPTMDALGVPLDSAQRTKLRRAAQNGLEAVERARADLDDRAILIRRMAVETAALAPWLESVDALLDAKQRAALRPEASRGRAGLDLVSPGLLWPTMRATVAADAADNYVQALDKLLLAPAFPAGSDERRVARRILEEWAAKLPASAFGTPQTTLDAYGFAQAERFGFWAARTADLLESLRDGAAVTPQQRERLARRLMPLVPLVPITVPDAQPR